MSMSDLDPLGKPFADCCCFSNVDRVSNRQSERGGRTVDIGSELSTSLTDSETSVSGSGVLFVVGAPVCPTGRQTLITSRRVSSCLLPPADRPAGYFRVVVSICNVTVDTQRANCSYIVLLLLPSLPLSASFLPSCM